MMRRSAATVIDFTKEPDPAAVEEAAEACRSARKAVAFSGAGVSVESGVPDFRSPEGIWARFPIEEYGSIDDFLDDPEKVWNLFRAMGALLVGAEANPAHLALGALEKGGFLEGVITQNIDGLHQAGGSRRVIELHGDHRTLQCVFCGEVTPLPEDLLSGDRVPACARCGHALKPNVVLFGEGVRKLDEVAALVSGCDLLLVVGTSAQVYPAAGIPAAVKGEGGRVFEFNTEPTALTYGEAMGLMWGAPSAGMTDYFFQGPAGVSLPALAEAVLGGRDLKL